MLLYIDPGTGSMLFTILLGVLSAGIYALRGLVVKLRFAISSGEREEVNKNKLPFVIFSDHKRYWNIFEPVCDEFERRGVDVVYMTASPDDPALEKKYSHITAQFIGEGNKAFAKLNMLNAGIVFSTTPSLDVYQWKRSRDVQHYTHIYHAPRDATSYRMFGIDYYDSILLSGQYQIDQIRKLEQLRNLPAKELRLVGIPYMDEMKKRVDSAPPVGEHPTTVLLAPSWGPSAILSRYGERMIQTLLDTGYHVIVRPHPQSLTSEKELLERIQAKFPESEQLEWNRDNDNFQVLLRSDIMISDFSGVMFEFALVFDKPIIYADTSFNKGPYDASWLDEEMWTFTALPRIGQQLTEENLPRIKEVIDTCLYDASYQSERRAARDETWMYQGEGAVRVVDFLMEKHEQLLAREAEEKEPEKQKKSAKWASK